jgi:glycosyltransferase involved in cell wall biosynthesis
MKRVLIFIAHYLPAARAGGPVRSVAALVESLKDKQFYIFTSETDFMSSKVLDGVITDSWIQKDSAQILYASSRNRGLRGLHRTLIETAPDWIYLNSFFALRFTLPILVLRKLRLIPNCRVIVAPHGEFSRGALAIKPVRKRAYRCLARWLGLYRGVVWHACSAMEVEDIRRAEGNHAQIVEAPNFPPPPIPDALDRHRGKETNRCRLVFLSRVSPMKNLLGAIEILARVRQPVSLDVYGPIEDDGYWECCQGIMKRLPQNVSFSYRGPVEPGQAETIFADYDALFLPTWGENYGYVIVEAWAAGTPVLISDRTPWTGLESDHSGWTIAPEDHTSFAACIENLARMDEAEHVRWREGAWAHAKKLARSNSLQEDYDRLFGPETVEHLPNGTPI